MRKSRLSSLKTYFGNTGGFRNGGHVGVTGWAIVAAQIAFYTLWLRALNLCSRRPLTGDCKADVSLTSYGLRITSVWSTIETIGRGVQRPGRLILWLDDESAVKNPPASLKRLIRRGLEVRPCKDFGPHKKYYPYVLECLSNRTLVTADDDIYYPKTWLSRLLAAHREDQVTAYRARIRTEDSYADWPMCHTDEPSERVFATGVSGIAYPPRLLEVLRSRGDEFLAVCPRADDFWLHFAAVGSGVPVCQINREPANWWPQVRLRTTGLWHDNLSQGGNDSVADATRRAWLAP